MRLVRGVGLLEGDGDRASDTTVDPKVLVALHAGAGATRGQLSYAPPTAPGAESGEDDNPYDDFEGGPREYVSVTSSIQRATTEPEWGEEWLCGGAPGGAALSFTVADHDALGRSDLLGQALVRLPAAPAAAAVAAADGLMPPAPKWAGERELVLRPQICTVRERDGTPMAIEGGTRRSRSPPRSRTRARGARRGRGLGERAARAHRRRVVPPHVERGHGRARPGVWWGRLDVAARRRARAARPTPRRPTTPRSRGAGGRAARRLHLFAAREELAPRAVVALRRAELAPRDFSSPWRRPAAAPARGGGGGGALGEWRPRPLEMARKPDGSETAYVAVGTRVKSRDNRLGVVEGARPRSPTRRSRSTAPSPRARARAAGSCALPARRRDRGRAGRGRARPGRPPRGAHRAVGVAPAAAIAHDEAPGAA